MLVLAVEVLGVLFAEAAGAVWSGRVRTRNAATTEATTRKAVRVRTSGRAGRRAAALRRRPLGGFI